MTPTTRLVLRKVANLSSVHDTLLRKISRKQAKDHQRLQRSHSEWYRNKSQGGRTDRGTRQQEC